MINVGYDLGGNSMNTLERSASQAFGTLMAQFYNTTRRV
jgi:hypothetical protein